MLFGSEMILDKASLLFIIWSVMIRAGRVVTSTSTRQQQDLEEFWISVNLLNVEWKPSCLIITYCNKPELKMIETNPLNGEKSSFSWQLDQNFEQLSNSIFISHWTAGSPVDIEMNIEIIGIDPKYRFQRSCDQTVVTKAFKYELQEEHFGNFGNSSTGNGSNLGQMIVELRGRCFNATLTVQKHIERSPWCTRIETATIGDSIKPYEHDFEFFPIKQYSLVMLICVVTSCLIIMCAVQCILYLYRKSGKLAKQKASVLPFVQSTNWKMMEINGNGHLNPNTMCENKSNNSSNRSTLKSESLINCAHDQIFANSDTIIESNRSSLINDRTYDNVAHYNDV
uniref:C2 domain-containing protein n=2 Tax=Brugia malayi TaxID=6279 RepID=A0A7I4KA18_BRUMA